MVFKVPKLPSKRRLSSSTETPSASPSVRQPSSSQPYSSPTARAVAHPHKRVGLKPPSPRASSVASLSLPRDPNALQQSNTPVHARTIQEQDDDGVEEDESFTERIMAVDMRNRGNIGCCYYVAQHEALYLLEDIRSAGLETIDLRMHIQSLLSLADRLIECSQIAHRTYGDTPIEPSRRERGRPFGPRRSESRFCSRRWYVNTY